MVDYSIKNAGREVEFDEINELASELINAPISIISLVEDKKQWIKSSFGVDIKEIPKEFFQYTSEENPDKIAIINNLSSDKKYKKTPFLLNNKSVAFYIGVPVIDENNIVLGTLTLIDYENKEINQKQLRALQILAKSILRLIESIKLNENNVLQVAENRSKYLALNNSFYLILNPNLEIIDFGVSFKKAFPQIKRSDNFYDYFDSGINIDSLVDTMNDGDSIFKLISSNNNLRFKCSILKLDSKVIISAQPIINDSYPIINYNISIADFSKHDYIIEYLFLQQSSIKALSESRTLMDRLTIKKDKLEEQKKLIERNEQLLKENLLKTAETKEKYSNLVHATNDLILTIDNSGTILFVNDSWLKKMNYTRADVLGNPIFNYVHPDSQEHCALFFQDLMSNSPEQLEVNYSLINRHGEKIEVEGTIICKYDLNEFSEVNSFLKDVTEINCLKRIEEEKTKEILKNKEKLEAVMDSLTETVWGVSLPDYKSEYISNSAIDLYGIPLERWINNSNTWFEAIHPDDIERVDRENSGLFSDGFSELEYRIVTPKNEVKWIQTRTKIITNGDGSPYLMTGIAADITKRKTLELELILNKQKLEEQKQFYEFILNNIPSDVAVFSPDHKYLFLNPQAIKNPELRNFMIGKDDFDYCEFKGLDSSLAIQRRKAFNEVIASKEFIDWEDEKILDNGNRHITLRKMAPIYNEKGELVLVIGYGLEITSRILAEENIVIAKKEVEQINLNLKSLVEEETTKNLKLSQSLSENEKMATIGELASGIAHDLNTPLGSIKNGAEAVKITINSTLTDLIWKFSREQIDLAISRSLNVPESEALIGGMREFRKSQEYKIYLTNKFKKLSETEILELSKAFVKARIDIDEESIINEIIANTNPLDYLKLIENITIYQQFINSIQISTDRAAHVVNDLRMNIKDQTAQKTLVNIQENIQSVINIFNFELKKDFELFINVDESINIFGYDVRLFQLWSNIVKNSIEALESKVGEKSIKISSSENSKTIDISIENNGPEIPIEIQNKIFDKFYSTKVGLRSSGIGLSIVKNILNEHNAKIILESSQLFTKFTIQFDK